MGVGAGRYLGSALASLAVPGVGPILAVGIGAAAVLGLGGAAVGGTLGNATEHSMDEGVPKDDVVVYRELLKRGRSLVIVNVDSEELADRARAVIHQNGTEDVETFRNDLREAAYHRALALHVAGTRPNLSQLLCWAEHVIIRGTVMPAPADAE